MARTLTEYTCQNVKCGKLFKRTKPAYGVARFCSKDCMTAEKRRERRSAPMTRGF